MPSLSLSLFRSAIRIVRFSAVLLALLVFPRIAYLQSHRNPPQTPTSRDALRRKEATKAVPDLTGASTESEGNIREAFGRLPMSFERNEGQVDARAKFISRGNGYTVFLTYDEAVLSLRRNPASQSANQQHARADLNISTPKRSVLRMKILNANPRPELEAQDEQTARSNYFIGNIADRWHTDVKRFGRVVYKAVYPGIDLAYYGKQHELEYDFVVGAGIDPRIIRIGFEGTRPLSLDHEGNLLLTTPAGVIRQQKPLVYQEKGNEKELIAANFVVYGKNQIGFRIGEYDHSKPLIIDPVLNYSSYLFGNGDDFVGGMRVDSLGNVYLTGWTASTDFPTANPIQSDGPGVDAFVTKLNPTGTALIYSTYLGGSGLDEAFILNLDSSGSVYVTGFTESTNFPLSAQPFQSLQRGAKDAFITKLNPAGNAITYSTYLGGNGDDVGYSIAVDVSGFAYIAGSTLSTTFPVSGALQSTKGSGNDGFVTKLSPNGSSLGFSTYLGGSGDDVALGVTLDSSGNIYLAGDTFSTNFPTVGGSFQIIKNTGSDGFITKMSNAGSMLFFSTFLGGNGDDSIRGIAVDNAGNSYVTGYTTSVNFPTTAGVLRTSFAGGNSDAFVTKLSAGGSSLVYSTFLGGTGTEFGDCTSDCIAIDDFGNASVIGRTTSIDFPVANSFQNTNRGAEDGYVTKLSATGAFVVYSSYLGGNSDDDCWSIALGSSGATYVAGRTFSVDFPTTPGSFQTTFGAGFDGFVSKITSTSVRAATVMRGDFDGDGKADLAVWRPSNALWFIVNSSDNSQRGQGWGATDDIPVPGDYDGDGKTDLAVWRPSNGLWFIINSLNNSQRLVGWGTNRDIPVPGDYDGDGKTDIAVWRPSNGLWLIINSSNSSQRIVGWGANGDVPVPADYDGDGKTDIAAWRPSTGLWFIINSLNSSQRLVGWGTSDDFPAPGDYDADNKADIAVWRPSVGLWFIINSSNGSQRLAGWGSPGDISTPADYDGDHKTDLAVWRPSNGLWFIINSTNGSQRLQGWGSLGDVPVPTSLIMR